MPVLVYGVRAYTCVPCDQNVEQRARLLQHYKKQQQASGRKTALAGMNGWGVI